MLFTLILKEYIQIHIHVNLIKHYFLIVGFIVKTD